MAETGGTLVEVWAWIITFQSKGRLPKAQNDALFLRSTSTWEKLNLRLSSLSASSFDLECLSALRHIASLSTIRSCRCFQCFLLCHSVCVHICAHIFRITLMFFYDKELTLSQPLRWICSLSYFIFSSLSIRWSEELFLKPPSFLIQLLKLAVINIRSRGATRNRNGSHVSLESLEGLAITHPQAPFIGLSHLLENHRLAHTYLQTF